MSNSYPPCHCLLDSAGYFGLVELLVRRRCQIARRLPGKPDQPDKLDKSVVSRQNSNRARPEHESDETQTAEEGRPFAFSLLPRRSVADAFPSPNAVAPTVDHDPPAHHAVAKGVGAAVGAAVYSIDSRGRHRCAEEKRYFNLAADFKTTFATRVCKPWFGGVWDTISTIGWYENPLQIALYERQSRH